ncbi:unnamed protein product [Gongylonema pulchrum]|uniref:VWFA domain-containing protein n=1 Tax=Gongylonema pulchrum TaxID=637853 RepID=A0A3P7RY82_9BILA|nr:unnamed protein product [Gongylonema pulchrum]
MHSRSKFDSSPAKALDLAAQQFINYGRSTANKLVILAHDGISTDLIAETLEARHELIAVSSRLPKQFFTAHAT